MVIVHRKGSFMKKTTLLAIVVVLSAIVGALAAMFVYLKKREAELDEYEQILFDSDWNYEQAEMAEIVPEEV